MLDTAVAISAAPLTVYHRGFAVSIHKMKGRDGLYGYVVHHDGLALHASGGLYGSATRAEQAGRQFVDDALGAFDAACLRLEVDA
jgi:hypothetical protein